jgi:DNA-binding LacI/PurR family transcriptional regulator
MIKRITAQDVAKAAGVSPTTVSFVLNNIEGMRISKETRDRVLEAAKSLNYHPDSSAQKMARGKTSVIGLILRQNPEKAYADLFVQEVMQGISSAIRENGYQMLFIPLPPEDKENNYSKLINERHVDGLIVSGPTEDDYELVNAFNEGAKIVLMGKIRGSNIPFVDIDNVKSAETAVEHLVSLGHERIAMITNAPLNYDSSKDRFKGYKNILAKNNLPFMDELVFCADRTPESGYYAMKKLIEIKPLPTAVFIASDTVALGSLNALYEKGINVPNDLAIVGFDDIALARYVIPPLTTIHLPAYSLGLGAASMLIQQLKNDFVESNEIFLQTRLIIRESSGKNINS